MTSRLPHTSKLRERLTVTQVETLWKSLQHPPTSYFGSQYIYRQADGGFNNILDPTLGRAGSPYARSVKPMTKMPGAPPDAYTVFDALYSRGRSGENYRPSNNNISSMLFYIASIIIHGRLAQFYSELNANVYCRSIPYQPCRSDHLRHFCLLGSIAALRTQRDTAGYCPHIQRRFDEERCFCGAPPPGFPPGCFRFVAYVWSFPQPRCYRVCIIVMD